MNRRSLLLGSLVAGAAGLFGVKAKVAVEPVEQVGIPWSAIRESQPVEYPSFIQEAVRLKTNLTTEMILNSPEYKALLLERLKEKMGYGVSGYGVMQEMMYPRPYRVTPDGSVEGIPIRSGFLYDYGNPYSIPWGSVQPSDLANPTRYSYSINPDLSDLMADDFDT